MRKACLIVLLIAGLALAQNAAMAPGSDLGRQLLEAVCADKGLEVADFKLINFWPKGDGGYAVAVYNPETGTSYACEVADDKTTVENTRFYVDGPGGDYAKLVEMAAEGRGPFSDYPGGVMIARGAERNSGWRVTFTTGWDDEQSGWPLEDMSSISLD
jgi:hypothetical protein